MSRILILLVLGLQGCAAVPLALTGVSVGSLVVTETTGKSVTDHAVSIANSQDCRTARYLKDEPICRDHPNPTPKPKTAIVYNTNHESVAEMERIFAARKATK